MRQRYFRMSVTAPFPSKYGEDLICGFAHITVSEILPLFAI